MTPEPSSHRESSGPFAGGNSSSGSDWPGSAADIGPGADTPADNAATATAADDGVMDDLVARLWLRQGDRLFVGGLAGVGLLLLVFYWGRLSAWGTAPIEIEHLPQAEYQYEIDINRATWVEWAQFNGIGETLAKRIVEERQTGGNFETVDDLLRVRGLGQRRIEEMRPYLRVEWARAPQRSAEPSEREPSDDDPEETSPAPASVP
jgi:competence protein ComEA